MPESITASEKNLHRVFCNDYLFEIPVYQRPYAWTTEEVNDLFDDLYSAMQRDEKEPYFLGSIVLIKGDDPGSLVVDGQQRLTTLTMLLCCLREVAASAIKSGIDQRIRQREDILTGAQEVVRLQLRPQDRDFFYQYVQSEEGILELIESKPKTETDSQERIYENVRLLHRNLAPLSPGDIEKLASFILMQCYIVVVSTPNTTSAYRIFSVLNNRGLDLSPTDILKAEIIGKLDEGEQETYGRKWEDIEQELGRDRFRDLFNHVRMIYGKAKLRRTILEEFREQVLSCHTGKDFIDDVLDRYDDVYKRVRGLSEDGQLPGRHLQYLRLLDNPDWIPPAMAFFSRHSNYPDLLDKFTQELERLAFGLFIRRAYFNERIDRYADVLKDIESDKDVFREEGPLQLRADEKSQIRRVLDGPIYTLPRVPGPLLLRLDSLLAEAGASWDHRIISVEHVLPQNPPERSQWIEWFPDAEQRGQWTHRLANLVLLSSRKNSRASNYPFAQKKDEYFRKNGVSTFALTVQVLDQVEWTPAVLEGRQTKLLNKLNEAWRLV